MSFNLFEKIINAIRPNSVNEEPGPSDAWPPESQADATSQSSTEDCNQSQEASEEPSPEFQEAVNPANPHQCQD